MRLLHIVIAEAENAPCPADPLAAVAEAVLELVDTARGDEQSFAAATLLMQLPAARARLDAMWQDHDRRRKVCIGAYQLIVAADQLRLAHRLPPRQAAMMEALRAAAERADG
ncbi:MAG: hypothetical protein H6747_08905 [Deltaproteobacteria bacterium]|nr:hypothetical protein [Deltaproteobacteria bacterium]